MFGYIKISKGELKIKEYELYKGCYCTLCKVLGKNYGIISRFTLNYDFTFLALLNMSLKENCDIFEQKRCVFNPLKKCQFCKCYTDFEMPSAATIIMSYYKLLDNIADEKGIKKLLFLLIKPFLKGGYNKAKKNYPEIDKIVSTYIAEQINLEHNKCDDVDKIAHPTAKALSQILSLCSGDDSQKRILDRLGYCLGRYIYLLDAFCDMETDIKKGTYNVLVFKKNIDIKEYVTSQIYFCINEATRAFELLNIKKYKNILGNILYLGLEEIADKEIKNERSV